MAEVFWLRALPRDPATAQPVEVLLAGGGQDAPYRHPLDNRQYRAGIVARPLFSATLGFSSEGWTGRTAPQTSAVGFAPADEALKDTLAGLVWDSAPITIETGEEGALPAPLLAGTVKDAEFTRDGLTLTVVDLSDGLERAVVSERFAGTGGIEGPVEAKDRAKRRSFGYVFNVEGRLLDVANSIYEFSDPGFAFTSWLAIRDKGRSGPFTVLAWQGSVGATFAALQASAPVRGGAVVAPSIACAKWWTVPSGPLTADVIGSAGTGGSMQAAAIADALAASGSGLAVAGLAAANALRPSITGLHIGTDRETFAQAIDRLLLGVSLLWLPQADGTIAILPWAFDAAAPVLKADFRGRARTYPPHSERRIGFQQNQRQHSDSEIAGILLDELLNDGSPVTSGDLLNSEQRWSEVGNDDGNRPEDGATRTVARGSYVAATTYQTGDVAIWEVASGGNGNSYLRIGPGGTVGISPSNGSKWALFALRGQEGAAGPDGVDGQDGAQGLQGVPGQNGVDGINGDDGIFREFVWRRAATQPATPGGNGVPSGWSDDPPVGTLPLWMSVARQELDGTLISGETWSVPVRHDGPPGDDGQDGAQGQQGLQGVPGQNGVDGINGDDGIFREFVWRRAATQPATPGGNGVPSGWSDDPPVGTLPLWMSVARQELDGTLISGETWSVPVRHDGPPGDDGQDGAQGQQGLQGVPGQNGVDGINGDDGIFREFVWRRAATQPATPGGNGVPSGWSDDPPVGTLPLWMSVARQELDGTLISGETWSVPVRHDGPPGDDGQDGAQGQQGLQGVPGQNGVDGINGDDGIFREFVWRRAATQPATPGGNGVPSGWSDDPPVGTLPLWMSVARQELDGTLISGETWSVPVRHDGPPGDDGQDGANGGQWGRRCKSSRWSRRDQHRADRSTIVCRGIDV